MAMAAFLLATATTDTVTEKTPDRAPGPQESAVVVDGERSHVAGVLEEKPKRTYMFGKLRPDVPEPMILKQDPKIRRQLAFVNTHAISCGSWKNELCIELEKQGIPVAHLKPSIKGTAHLFSDHLESLESYEAFEARIVELLQPESVAGHLSYEQRLNNATEILARSALGVYQLLFRYYGGHIKQSFRGAAGRKNMFRLISSKAQQDELVDVVIQDLGRKYKWNIPVMAADYYGGPKLAIPLSEKLDGSTEHDALLYGRRYHNYPSVMDYIASFEDNIRQYAINEGLDPDNLSRDDQIRLMRYAIAKRESDFDMQTFEENN